MNYLALEVTDDMCKNIKTLFNLIPLTEEEVRAALRSSLSATSRSHQTIQAK